MNKNKFTTWWDIALSVTRDSKLFTEGVWVAIGQVSIAVAMLVGIRLLTEFLPSEIFGMVSLLIGIVGLGRNLFCLPFTQAGQRFYVEAERGRMEGVLRRSLSRFLRLGTSIFAILVIAVGAGFSKKMNVSVWAFLCLAGIVVLDAWRTMETCLLNVARRQKAFSIVNAADAWARPLFAIAAVCILGVSVSTVLLGYLLASGIVLVGLYAYPGVRVAVPWNEDAFDTVAGWSKKIWIYSLPLIPLGIFSWISGLSDRYIIAALMGTDKVGIYVAGYGLVSTPFLMMGSVLALTLRPVLFDAVESKSKEKTKKIFSVWLALSVSFAMLMAVFVYVFADPIVSLLLAREYRISAEYIPWIALGYSFQVIGYVFAELWLAHKKPLLYLYSTIVGAVVSVLLCLLLVKYFGLIGASVSCAISFLVVLLFNITMTDSLVRC